MGDISQRIAWNCGASCVCVQPAEHWASQDLLATRPWAMASLQCRGGSLWKVTHVKQQRFLNQKLGKRVSRKSELRRAKLETTRALARQKDKR